MNETQYESYVVALEESFRGRISATAAAEVARSRRVYPGVEMNVEASGGARDLARERVEDLLLHHTDWEDVLACDISDIALEAADRALAEA